MIIVNREGRVILVADTEIKKFLKALYKLYKEEGEPIMLSKIGKAAFGSYNGTVRYKVTTIAKKLHDLKIIELIQQSRVYYVEPTFREVKVYTKSPVIAFILLFAVALFQAANVLLHIMDWWITVFVYFIIAIIYGLILFFETNAIESTDITI